jgi:MFS family permease
MPSPAHAPRTRRIRDLIVETLRDAWHVAKVPRGQLALLLCAVPLGLAVSSGLWSAMASEWDTDSDTVAVVSGILGGVVSSIGCLAGGWCCERWDRQRCYVVFGILVAVIGAAMASLPHTKGVFVSLALLMSFCAGMSWAAYTAFVLDVIGVGGAATKFSAFASLANLPIWYMGHVNGWALKKWDTNAMLYLEAALGIAAAIVFLIAAKLLLRRARRTETPGAP